MKRAAFLPLALLSVTAFSQQLTYYIGVDSEKTLVPFPHEDPTYNGLSNPNFGRLTFLYAHWLGPPAFPVQASHYHPRSAYGYYGPAATAIVTSDAGADSEIPEAYTGCPGLLLAPGTGAYAGKLTSYTYNDTSQKSEGHYSNLTVGSTDSLANGFSPADAQYWLYRAENGYFMTSLAGSDIAIKAFGITPGLHLDVAGKSDVFASSDTVDLGDGSSLNFSMVFWTDASAAPGDYVASLVLTDRNSAKTGFKDSGVFHFHFRMPPLATSLTIASAASYATCTMAPSQLVSIFGTGLAAQTVSAPSGSPQATLGGVSAKLTDSSGATMPVSLYAVSPTQVNAVLPGGIANGDATITLETPLGSFGGITHVAPSAPALFSADGSGNGLAAAQVVYAKADGSQTIQPAATYDQAQGKYVAAPIDLSDPSTKVYLVLYGSGFRGISSLDQLSVTVGPATAQVLYAGPSGAFPGLDQMNLLLPSSLAGAGQVYVIITIGDFDNEANLVSVTIQ